MTPQLLSGARCLVSINNSRYGAGFVLSYRFATAQNEEYCVDSPLPFELVPGPIGVQMSLKIYRTPDNDPSATGLAPKADLAAGTYVHRDYTESDYLTVEVRDRVTDMTVLYIPKAAVTDRSGTMSAEDLLEETLVIKGIGFRVAAQQKGIIPAVTSVFKP
jgi:hypothetical protein